MRQIIEQPALQCRKRKRGKPASSLGVTGRLARDVTLRDVPVDSLHIEKVIAQGACGNIAEGRIHNTRVAIKIAPLASSRGPVGTLILTHTMGKTVGL